MINIPLPFLAMWGIMLAGVMTNILARVNIINQKSPSNIAWTTVLKQFFRKEWASYVMSIIFTGIVAYSFVYMKQFDHVDNEEISRWAKWIPLAVLILYVFGIINQWALYRVLGRIQSKGEVDVDVLTNTEKEKS